MKISASNSKSILVQFFDLASADLEWYKVIPEACELLCRLSKVLSKGDATQQAVLEAQFGQACSLYECQGFINGFRFAMEMSSELLSCEQSGGKTEW